MLGLGQHAEVPGCTRTYSSRKERLVKARLQFSDITATTEGGTGRRCDREGLVPRGKEDKERIPQEGTATPSRDINEESRLSRGSGLHGREV